ncbi:lysozyme [Pseudaminobacter salicylatoxidans]|uniref:Lysozyme n=2 Tax=Pseudaminobacter salicylatoxidans TaxID=93369 RepID=A0A316BS10_PSESE|nr:lysozyme [Pseudaminobacter salicylatoxidans]
MRTSQSGRGDIARREGTVLTAYQDSAGIWTIGTGHTSAAGAPKVVKGMKISAWEADQILTRDLAAVEGQVSAAVKVPLNQNEFDALVSLCFNIGGGAFKNSTLVRKLNAGDRAGAANQFLVWNKITKNGKKVELRGLTIRRQDERKQFLTPFVTTPKPINTKASEPQKAPQVTTSPSGFWAALLSILKAIFKGGR